MNKDLAIAKKYLYDYGKTLVIVKDEEVIYESDARGIKPIYEFYRKNANNEAVGSLADKVFGKAAAIIASHLALDCIYAETISKEALKVLNENNIDVSYKIITDQILNRAQDDLCPVEKISKDYEDFHDLLAKIESFLESIK